MSFHVTRCLFLSVRERERMLSLRSSGLFVPVALATLPATGLRSQRSARWEGPDFSSGQFGDQKDQGTGI